ncbi:unnamed protein product [Protopolystoma xenopodis]|uniref:Uncharacterized protein n=1 Tax=Protopolystoma xenopodis TaxID=117903 RepID=A0A3S4ZFF3_9PLAT|nr:unnamed protein product [Protopolystoma xenopodis]
MISRPPSKEAGFAGQLIAMGPFMQTPDRCIDSGMNGVKLSHTDLHSMLIWTDFSTNFFSRLSLYHSSGRTGCRGIRLGHLGSWSVGQLVNEGGKRNGTNYENSSIAPIVSQGNKAYHTTTATPDCTRLNNDYDMESGGEPEIRISGDEGRCG